jgi:phosphoenolpyruvate synthase/pyruvate phosphate dikinase
MNTDEIIRMAQEAGIFTPDLMCVTVTLDMVERFAALVAAAEREACVDLCILTEQMCKAVGLPTSSVEACAEAIRARGNE